VNTIISEGQIMITEGLRHKDLNDFIYDTITIDRFKSKMGEDQDIVVLSFRVKDKHVAIDLMEFIEKGYPFVLDSDMSSGEEQTGDYSVFVEIERTKKIPKQIDNLLSGVDNLTNIDKWKFKYYRDIESLEVNEDNINNAVPLTPEDYKKKILKNKEKELTQFFSQGATESINFENDDNFLIRKPFSESLKFKLINIGPYEEIKKSLPGGIQLDNTSRNQTVFLEKYLGNYEIYKINEKFLIRNNDQAIIVENNRWN
jgi:hypothetical protein